MWNTEQRHVRESSGFEELFSCRYALKSSNVQAGEETTTPMSKQITLGWDYWNKNHHDLRRDMLQLHYYLHLEPEMTVHCSLSAAPFDGERVEM